MKALEDRLGERDGIRAMLREQLNSQGDKVVLREQDVEWLVEATDALVDMLRDSQERERKLRENSRVDMPSIWSYNT